MPKFIARFSNGLVITAKDQRRSYTHAWHATGRHAIGNEPWSFNGFGTSPFLGSTSDKPVLACVCVFGRAEGKQQ